MYTQVSCYGSLSILYDTVYTAAPLLSLQEPVEGLQVGFKG